MKPKHKNAQYFMKMGLFNNLKNFADFENRVLNLPDNERGVAFEVFAEAYLKTQAITQAEEVWPSNAIPQNIQIALGLPIRDMGIDGIFRTFDGKYHAYQVKYRANRRNLSWSELSTFMGLSDKFDKRVLFTNSKDISSVMDARVDFYSIKGNDLDNLDHENFQTIENWLNSSYILQEKKPPLPHQIEAINDILKTFVDNDRTTAIMACGTGKTLVGMWIAEHMNAKTILVLLPSLALVRQTLYDWVNETNWEKFNYLCVCSDPTVAKGYDEIVLNQHDLDFPVTTRKETVKIFLENKDTPRKIIFSTYQSCPIIAEAMPKGSIFDLAIFDEAHKTAARHGANYAFALKNKNLSIKKRLFLTATPRHYNINRKDKEGNQYLAFSMDDPKVYGPIAHRLSFGIAVRKKLICNYKVIISVITSEMVDRELLKQGKVIIKGDVIKAQRIANILAIRDATNKYDIKRIFSFHNSVSAAESFTANSNEGVGGYLKDFTTFHVNGRMTTSTRESILDEFKKVKKAIISNARCLTEGVNVPIVDMVAFISPKRSFIDIVQATGRAMRKAYKKKFGYILIPLFMEMTNNESTEKAVEKTQFDTVWNVLQAMQEQDEILAQIIAQMREDRGLTLGVNDNRLKERIEILGPELELNILSKAIITKIIDKLSSTWDERFGELKLYKKQHGHCNVSPLDTKYHTLARWVIKQRSKRSSGKLLSIYIDKLNSIGFDWDPIETRWDIKYKALCAFKKTQGNCDIPENYDICPELPRWVAKQRAFWKKNKLSKQKIDKLIAVNFVFEPFDEAWEEMFSLLCKFKEANGHCNVPRNYPQNPKLSSWLTTQRLDKRKGRLFKERAQRLTKIGFTWEPRTQRDEDMFLVLLDYKNEYGECNVPDKYVYKSHTLGIWIGNLRSRKNRGKLSSSFIKRLNDIGFNWEPLETQFNQRFNKYFLLWCQFQEKGNIWNNNDTTKKELFKWARQLRGQYKKGSLKLEYINRMNSIAFDWDPFNNQWQKRFDELCEFKKANGHCNVPRDYHESRLLATWTQEQRTQYSQNRLNQKRIEKLNDIGFHFIPRNSQWDKSFIKLCEFQKINGHCNVTRKNEPSMRSLATWVAKQHKQYTDGILPKDRIEKLNKIGFDWVNAYNSNWDIRYKELCEFKKVNGHCNVTRKDYPSFRSLITWTAKQRKQYIDNILAKEHIERLNMIGFNWGV